MPRPTLLGLACALAVAGSPAFAAPVVTDLGEGNLVQSVSDDGAVVAGLRVLYDGGAGKQGVTRWTAATGTRLIGGSTEGFPAVSADGRVIAATLPGADAAAVTEAAFWSEAEGWKRISEFEMIPALPGWATRANAVSANGERLAGVTAPPPVDFGNIRAFSFNPDTWTDRWADYGWQELPMIRKGSFSEATAISDDGLIQAGISTTGTSSAFHAVVWTDGRIRQLHDGSGAALGGESVACNRDCSVIVGGGGGNSMFQPVLAWRYLADGRGGGNACHFNPETTANTTALRYYARATSENGGIVAGTYYYDEVPPGGGLARNVAKGFLWIGDANGGTMHELTAYLAGLGLAPFQEWLNVNVTDVSNDGRYLVGWGDDAQGVTRGWHIDFGGTPVATGGKEDYTACPKRSRLKPPVLPRVATAAAGPGDASAAVDRELPFGRFQAVRGGPAYVVEPRGIRLYGGVHRGRMVALRSLGGDQYLDPATGLRLAFARDRRGLVTGLTERREGTVAQTWRPRLQD